MPITSHVVDSWAWVEYLRGSTAGESVRKELEEGNELLTNAVTLAELMSKFKREHLDFENAWRAVRNLSKIIPVTENDAKAVGILHATVKETHRNFSLADAFVLQTAKKYGTRILTGDPDFKGLREAHMI